MIHLFGKNEIEGAAPVTGEIVDITSLADGVFSAKMLGDGFAVKPTADVIKAPCDGHVVLLAKTLHAVAIETRGVQVLIHIGLDTVNLAGVGFKAYVKEDMEVKKGDPLVYMDRAQLKEKGYVDTTVVVITNEGKEIKIKEKRLDQPEAVLLVEAG